MRSLTLFFRILPSIPQIHAHNQGLLRSGKTISAGASDSTDHQSSTSTNTLFNLDGHAAAESDSDALDSLDNLDSESDDHDSDDPPATNSSSLSQLHHKKAHLTSFHAACKTCFSQCQATPFCRGCYAGDCGDPKTSTAGFLDETTSPSKHGGGRPLYHIVKS